jgi:hypothetical protein
MRDAFEPDPVVDADRAAVGLGEQVDAVRAHRGGFRDAPAREYLRVPAAPCVGERDDVIDERGTLEHQERRERDPTAAVDHREPAAAGRDQHVALHRLQLVERVRIRDVEQSRRVPVVGPERPVERRDLLDLAHGLGAATGGHHHQVPHDPFAAGARGDDEVRLVLGVEDHDVGTLDAAREHRGQERSLDLLEPDGLPGLDPRVVRLLDRREPSVRDDGAPPPRLGALEQGVLSPPEAEERLEVGHAAIFAADAPPSRPRTLVRRRRCDRLAPP